MRTHHPLDLGAAGVVALSPGEAHHVRAASLLDVPNNEGAFAYDVGRLIGIPVALFLLMGRAFYENGGLTGGNPWLRRDR